MLQLLYKYMTHVQHLEESSFIELINTPFSTQRFSEEELTLLREMELSIFSGERIFFEAASETPAS
jgi:hypothetical protein